MKKINIAYWIVTGLFAAFMLFSAVPDAIPTPEAVKFITDLGYPEYIIRFLGIAKILGVIAILIPGYPRLREWAYAGLFFDLTAATASALAVEGFNPMQLFMLLFFAPGVLSYIYYHKKLEGEKVSPT